VSLLTIYLAKLLGLYCIILAVALSMNKQKAIATVNEWMLNAPLMLLTGAITLTLGLGMFIGHNVWSGGVLPVTVTILGWLMLIKGFTFLAVPMARAEKLYEALQYEKFFFVYMSVTLVIGIYLTGSAFWAS
jgi:hypothetical protein